MSSFATFLGKESCEIARTWRIWVLPGMLLFFSLTSPILALLTPSLVSSLAGTKSGVVIRLPEPVATDAYQQCLKDMNQIILVAIVIAAAGCVSGERRSGTAMLVLTKPLSRASFLLAKILAQQALVVLSTVVGAGLCAALTTLLFGSSPIAPFLLAVLLWLVLAFLLIVVMTLLSVLFSSQGGACGIGLGVYFLIQLLGLWTPATDFTPAGLVPAGARLLAGDAPAVLWPVTTAVLLAIVLGLLAVLVFQRKDL
jgi:ABC-2 type transport system permease protein